MGHVQTGSRLVSAIALVRAVLATFAWSSRCSHGVSDQSHSGYSSRCSHTQRRGRCTPSPAAVLGRIETWQSLVRNVSFGIAWQLHRVARAGCTAPETLVLIGHINSRCCKTKNRPVHRPTSTAPVHVSLGVHFIEVGIPGVARSQSSLRRRTGCEARIGQERMSQLSPCTNSIR
jgi:hypothetical protein